MIVAQGGAFAGWSLYLHEGKPKYCHNLAGLDALLRRRHRARSRREPPGPNGVRLRRRRAGQGRARRTLYIDGKPGRRRSHQTPRVPMIYSGDETCDWVCDTGTPVSEDYTSESSHFTGRVNWVELEIGDDSHDHLISAEELMRVATAIQ